MTFTSDERVAIRSALSAALDHYLELSNTAARAEHRAYYWTRVEETRAGIRAFERELYGVERK